MEVFIGSLKQLRQFPRAFQIALESFKEVTVPRVLIEVLTQWGFLWSLEGSYSKWVLSVWKVFLWFSGYQNVWWVFKESLRLWLRLHRAGYVEKPIFPK